MPTDEKGRHPLLNITGKRFPVYTQSLAYATAHGELRAYHKSRRLNQACFNAIEKGMYRMHVDPVRYPDDVVAYKTIKKYGPGRVAWVLANAMMKYQAKMSKENVQWAKAFHTPAHPDFKMNIHAPLLNYRAYYFLDILEKYNHLAAAELSSEQNYNMIDGVPNNLPQNKADLTDGQTYDELRELAPETLPETRQSLLEQVQSWEDNQAEGGREAAPYKQKEEML